VLSLSRSASAQVHWDVGAQVGAMRRIFIGGTGDGGFGPVATVQGHVALLPLIRVGGYFSHDIAPTTDDAAARHVTSGGLRVKGNLPWLRGKVHAWVLLGFGYAGVYGPSYHQPLNVVTSASPTPVSRDALVTGAGGSHFEVPVGVGFGYRFRRPWELTLELGSRFGFGFSGSLYNDPGRFALPAGEAPARLSPVGADSVAPFLVLGLSLDL
jgi:hypothetical protein